MGFTGDSIVPIGMVDLYVTFGFDDCFEIVKTKFLIVDIPFTYNVIIGRPTLNCIRAMVSTYLMRLKFPTSSSVGEIRSDPKDLRHCYLTLVTLLKKVTLLIQQMDPREPSSINPYPEAREPL
ncbi:unnamed protein product [Musa textilis]